MNNDKVPNCNATVNVGAASMYTNAVSAFSAGTGGKVSDGVVTTSDFTVTSDNKVDRNSSCTLSTSASTACSDELPVVQSICSAPVETAVSMEVGANQHSAYKRECLCRKEEVVKAVQSLKTRSNNSKTPDSHLSENVDTHAVECEDQAAVAGEGQSGGIQSNPGGG